MLFPRNSRLAVAPLLALLSGGQGAHADSSPASSSTSAAADATSSKAATTTAQPTCEFRTVNYITHTLPQQCLTSPPPTVSSTSPESSVVVSTTASAPLDATAGDAAAPPSAEEHELDSDGNDLSTGAFMSFEEWKEMMLKRSGQDSFEDRPRKPQDGRGDVPGQDFGTMGDEGEISLDFDAYSDKISEITAAGKPSQEEEAPIEDSVEKVSYDESFAHVYRSKDAGKTCKERFSYSSFDAGATVLKTSPGAKNSKAILVENKDSYMLMECGTKNKFFIVELSDDVRVDTVVLANFEFFSSMVRQFRVSVSDRYPVKLDKWKVLGEFTARNSRDIQPFLVEHPQIWARYLRVEVLSHYGKEFYCPISLLRVHGTRMLDSWRETDLNDADNEIEGEEETVKSIESADDSVELVETIEIVVDEEVEETVSVENKTTETLQSNVKPSYWDPSYFEYQFLPDSTCAPGEEPPKPSQTSPGTDQDHQAAPAKPKAAATAEESGKTTSTPASEDPSSGSAATETTVSQTSNDMDTTNERPGTTATNVTSAPTNATVPTSTSEISQTSVDRPSSDASSKSTTHVPNKTKPLSVSTSLKHPSSKTVTPKVVTGTISRNKTATATSSGGSASPTVQDSFFKHVTKRLQNLESNTTLSMQYIESQSKFLQEALAKLERRHASKVDLFLDSLNKTVMTELREFRSQYDQIWQSTIIALESQREKFEHENVALSSRIGLLADEVVFQKRMAIVQSILLLGCLILVVFGRGIGNAGLELYYPTHLQGSFSRFASPLSPGGRRSAQRNQNSLRESVEDTDGASANRGLTSDSDTNNTPPRQRISRSATPDLRPPTQQQNHLTVPKTRRPSPTRSVSETTGKAFYQPPTPASLDAGYDSEPSNMPSSPRPDYFSSKEDEEYMDSIEDIPAEMASTLTDTDTDSRLSTPALDGDDMIEDSRLKTHNTTRIPMSSAAGIKPLPALPEDSD